MSDVFESLGFKPIQKKDPFAELGFKPSAAPPIDPVAAAKAQNAATADNITRHGTVIPPEVPKPSALEYAKSFLLTAKGAGKASLAGPVGSAVLDMATPEGRSRYIHPIDTARADMAAVQQRGVGGTLLDTVKSMNPIATGAPTMQENTGASVMNLTALLAGLRGGAKQALPSAERAGAKFASVEGAAGKMPVDVNVPGETALRIKQLADSGGTMPKVVRDFLRRVTDPNQPAMNYEEARKFYSNATRLSFDEQNRLTPQVKREVGQFTRDLNESITKTAGDAGQGENYQAAMGEFRKAMKVKGYSDKAIELLIKHGLVRGVATGLGVGGGAALGYEAFKK